MLIENKIADSTRPEYDLLLQHITDYVLNFDHFTISALQTARYALMDSISCALMALKHPACTRLLGPIVPGTLVPKGSRVLGTHYCLDPVKAAWDTGCLIRWLDYNDTWLAQEWGHPSDNLGAILSVADFLSQNNDKPMLMNQVLKAMILAYEIQGVLALNHAFNRIGLDHVLLVKIASTAVCCYLYGASREQTLVALSHAWVDGHSLRTYRHAPNTTPRKSWAAGDATARAVFLTGIALKNEIGIPSVLTAPNWGAEAKLFNPLLVSSNKHIQLAQPLSCYVMENILFKVSFPAEFHAQTACEAAIELHPQVVEQFDEIHTIVIETHESAIRIISKEGQLSNSADRDHCLQYMVAACLIEGDLKAEYYEDSYHQSHSNIDQLRSKMTIIENKQYSEDYLDPNKRSIANAIQITFKDGKKTPRIEVQYPVGHKRRRAEGFTLLERKFEQALDNHKIDLIHYQTLWDTLHDNNKLDQMPVAKFMDMLVTI